MRGREESRKILPHVHPQFLVFSFTNTTGNIAIINIRKFKTILNQITEYSNDQIQNSDSKIYFFSDQPGPENSHHYEPYCITVSILI